MPFDGLTDPTAVEIDGNHYVQFDDGKVIECQTTEEANALAYAWRVWPFSSHPPVEASRSAWRTGFADGAHWHAQSDSEELRDAIEHLEGAVEFQDAINPEALRVVIAAAKQRFPEPSENRRTP